MQIQKSLVRFTNALQQNIPIICETDGSWRRENDYERVVRLLTGNENANLMTMASVFCQILDQLERTPVLFSANPEINSSKATLYQTYVQAARAVKKTLKGSSSLEIKEKVQEIAQKTLALKYRIEELNGGLARASIDQEQLQQIISLAAKWKSKQKLFPSKVLTTRDLSYLEESCSYPKFVKFLMKDEKLQERFFSWIIRDNGGVSQFIEFPEISNRIKIAHLTVRVGRFGSHLFSIEKRSVVDNKDATLKEKVICLPFYTKGRTEQISILDETLELELQAGWRLSIKKILDCFKNKNRRIGDLEFFGSLGITSWNAHKLGWWDPKAKRYNFADVNQKEWWQKLPIFDKLSKDELEKRTGIQLNEGEWLACAKSSRQTADLDLDSRHGYIAIWFPLENGEYCHLPVGKFAKHFPHGTLELLSFITATVPASLSFPDENEFYSHRQHATYPIRLTTEQGHRLMEMVRQEIISARRGHSVFQFGSENCAFWVQSILEKLEKSNVPNLFKHPILESQPRHPFLRNIFDALRQVPEKYRKDALNIVDRAMGSWRGIEVVENGKKVVKSMRSSPVRTEGVIYQPGLLHQQIEEGKLEGKISFGI